MLDEQLLSFLRVVDYDPNYGAVGGVENRQRHDVDLVYAKQTNDFVEPADFVVGVDRKLNDRLKGARVAYDFC